jgi:hypothetical protein
MVEIWRGGGGGGGGFNLLEDLQDWGDGFHTGWDVLYGDEGDSGGAEVAIVGDSVRLVARAFPPGLDDWG